MKAVNLRAGDILCTVNGEYVIVEQVQHKILESPETVYNFRVAENHTYYVGRVGVGVHNDMGCTQPAGSGENGSKSKWWHEGYVDNLSDTQILLGVKQSGKGLSTLGSATRENATSAGKAWVGENYNIIKDNAGNILGYSSVDGMRAFRIQYKPKEGMWRANFQENVMVNNPYPNTGQHRSQLKNVHIDIFD